MERVRSSGSAGSSGSEEGSDDDDVVGLDEAASIYSASPRNPQNTRLRRWKRTLALLILAAALDKCVLLTCVSSESLAAFSITDDASISTLPATTRQIGAALASAPASFLMGRVGRRRGFVVGGLLGVAGGLTSALALQLRSFPLLLFGTMVIGAQAGFGNYARYAAVEVVPAGQQPRAISLTVSGSVFSAVVGPRIAQFGADLLPGPFVASFLTAALVALLFVSLIACNTGLPGRPTTGAAARLAQAGAREPPATVRQVLRHPGFLPATAAQVGAYLAMVFVMTATPLAMTARGYEYGSIAGTISAHAVGMFLPGL